jgi:hypothetical protein
VGLRRAIGNCNLMSLRREIRVRLRKGRLDKMGIQVEGGIVGDEDRTVIGFDRGG